jgi:hypothetical protein
VGSLHVVSEDDMIAAFVNGEIDSEDFGPGYRAGLHMLDLSRRDFDHLAPARQKDVYRCILRRARGYPDEMLFHGVPRDVIWHRGVLTMTEVGGLRYIDESRTNSRTWTELSQGTRLVRDGAANAAIDPLTDVKKKIRDLVAKLVSSRSTIGDLIVVGTERDGPLVLLEGHTRATAYLLARQTLPDEVSVVVGTSAQFPMTWPFF